MCSVIKVGSGFGSRQPEELGYPEVEVVAEAEEVWLRLFVEGIGGELAAGVDDAPPTRSQA